MSYFRYDYGMIVGQYHIFFNTEYCFWKGRGRYNESKSVTSSEMKLVEIE